MLPTLTICILAKESVKAETIGSLLNVSSDILLFSQFIINTTIMIGQSNLPKTRSKCLTDWYHKSKDKDLFIFIDADQTFTTHDLIHSIKKSKKYDVICGIYGDSKGQCTSKPYDIQKFHLKRKGLLQYGATGFMLITRNIVTKIIDYLKYNDNYKVWMFEGMETTPFFYERIIKGGIWLSEDYSFCHLVTEVKGKIYGYMSDTIGHIVPQTVYYKNDLNITPILQKDDSNI